MTQKLWHGRTMRKAVAQPKQRTTVDVDIARTLESAVSKALHTVNQT